MKSREQMREEIQAEINAGRIINTPKEKMRWTERIALEIAKDMHRRGNTPFMNKRIR